MFAVWLVSRTALSDQSRRAGSWTGSSKRPWTRARSSPQRRQGVEITRSTFRASLLDGLFQGVSRDRTRRETAAVVGPCSSLCQMAAVRARSRWRTRGDATWDSAPMAFEVQLCLERGVERLDELVQGFGIGLVARLRSPLWFGRMSAAPWLAKKASSSLAIPLVGEDPLPRSNEEGSASKSTPGTRSHSLPVWQASEPPGVLREGVRTL